MTTPNVVTGAANPVNTTTATLNGTVNPNSLSTTYKFDYGTTTGYGTSTSPTSAAPSGNYWDVITFVTVEQTRP